MADKINITRLLKQINEFGHDANRVAVAVTNETANKISNQARLRAPVDLGQLRLSIGKTTARVGFNTSVIFANAPYSPYVEFGTGGLVSVPKGFEELAIRFKGKGIRKINIRPQPYFIPSYLEGVQEYPKQLEKILAREIRNLNAKK
jgi:HK97 gp10 family phage protein